MTEEKFQKLSTKELVQPKDEEGEGNFYKILIKDESEGLIQIDRYTPIYHHNFFRYENLNVVKISPE
jgi:hypothetical protein